MTGPRYEAKTIIVQCATIETQVEREEYIKKLKNELRETASKILNDKAYFIEGIRAVKDRLNTIPLDHEDLNLFRGVDSETDDIPIGETRELWNKEALQEIDNELVDYIEKVRPQVNEACKRIIEIIDES